MAKMRKPQNLIGNQRTVNVDRRARVQYAESVSEFCERLVLQAISEVNLGQKQKGSSPFILRIVCDCSIAWVSVPKRIVQASLTPSWCTIKVTTRVCLATIVFVFVPSETF